jgi:hypothetical protein
VSFFNFAMACADTEVKKGASLQATTASSLSTTLLAGHTRMNGGADASSASVASRFVSEAQLTEAQKKREEDIRAAYARMGQSPPPGALQSQEDYDPRTLYDKLKANSDAKQEVFEEKMKLSNQFRGIDDAESQFLEEVAKERREEQRQREEETRLELEEFRK